MKKSIHIPVMLDKVLNYLEGEKRNLIVDCTFGGGGHSREILIRHKNIKIIGLDRDFDAVQRGRVIMEEFKNRLNLYHRNFKDLPLLLESLGINQVDAMLLDLGVSSDLIEDKERGFSFQNDGPLDMRMDKTSEITAEIIVNNYPKEKLEKIFFEYGEERYSRKVAKAICEYRKKRRIQTVFELVDILLKNVPKTGKIHPATRVFQALRMEVNDELGALRQFLVTAPAFLSNGGRILVISFHSLEDRIVKYFFREKEKAGILKVITKKPVTPEQSEITLNRRSRSAKLRVAEKMVMGGN